MSSNIQAAALYPRPKGASLDVLVVVITLLGVVASFAVPRFSHLPNVVRASEVVALSVNLRSAAAVAHAQYSEPGAGSRLSSAILKGRTIQLKNGYPDAGPDGIRAALADLSDFRVSATPTSVTYSKSDAPFPAQCAVTYRASPAPSTEATITDLKTSGC